MSGERRHQHWKRVWLWPIAIAVVSAAGLVTGLVGDGVWDWFSWLALGLPVAVCLWFGWGSRPA
jgi:hypothetical protein